MKSALPLTSIICLLATVIPASAQVDAQARSTGAHRIARTEGGRVEQASGLLVSDPRRGELRFEADGATAFAVPFDRIAAMHHETAVEPSKWGWPLKDTKYYVTIHYADSAGQAAFETLRLSEREIPEALAMLETHTGFGIDRTLASRSFLGIPIRAAIGDQVAVTDQSGQTSKGTITALSASSVTLEGSSGTQVFDRESVSQIKRTRSRGRDALKGFGIGAVTGAIVGAWAGRRIGGDATSAFQGAAVMGTMMGGMDALIWAALPSYRFRATRDVYLAGTRDGSTPAVITIAPHASGGSKGVAISVRF